jgi:squalene synthase HpnC
MRAIREQIQDWFPDPSAAKTYDLAAAEQYTQKLATSHYENFPLASAFLPKRLQQHFYNVYGFCRWADDLGDEIGDPEISLQLLTWWRDELQACFRGECRHPVFVALKPTIDRFALPIEPFDHLIQAFEQDQRVTEYDTYEQLLDYCQRSANPVGRLVLMLFECGSTENVALSDAICTALQLANFWQDVARDLDIPRVYLPKEDFTRFGYSRDELFERKTTPEFLELMKFQVDRTRTLFHQGLPLVERLPGRLQLDIDLFARGGLRILQRIERIGFRVLETRPVVTKLDIAGLFCRCLFSMLLRRLNPRRWFGRT